jgi:4-hydroxy 2-oxovalerate aldolase
MELLLGFLRNPKFRLRPVVELIRDHVDPLRESIEWGPLVPYNLTGQMNRHPRAAMDFRASDNKDDYVKFYDQLMSDI